MPLIYYLEGIGGTFGSFTECRIFKNFLIKLILIFMLLGAFIKKLSICHEIVIIKSIVLVFNMFLHSQYTNKVDSRGRSTGRISFVNVGNKNKIFKSNLDRKCFKEQVVLKNCSPSSKLLIRQKQITTAVRSKEIDMSVVVKILHEFAVGSFPESITNGPTLTRYAILLSPGIKIGKINCLDRNIALGLHVSLVRVVAPMKGTGNVGVEILNNQTQMVRIRNIFESCNWFNSNAIIPIVLGRDVSGRSIITDLSKMPHLLIAGSTGSGKTMCINSIIISLIYRYSPRNLRLVIIDPKIVEMQIYSELPHLKIPIANNSKDSFNTLRWLVNEMDERYRLLAKKRVQNISEYNKKILKECNSFNKKLPYMICIIDELSDLMMVSKIDMENYISRLTQLARAAGVHLIISTQRPSVDVVTGVIKANLNGRISFRVASKVDSRTILDMSGSETLTNCGDMLFKLPGIGLPYRVQGVFLSNKEISRAVSFVKKKPY